MDLSLLLLRTGIPLLLTAIPVAAAEMIVEQPPEQDGALCELHFTSGAVMSAIPAAVTPSAQYKGLSGGAAPHNHRMLFWWDTPDYRSFWISDVPIALDIAFLSETGELIQLVTAHPENTQVFRSKKPVKLVIEQPAGYFAARNIQPGDTLVGLNCSAQAFEM